jgi:hypothetical protein
VHYVGNMDGTVDRTLFDQIINGQLKWVHLDKQYNTVTIGSGSSRRDYPIMEGVREWRQALAEKFPSETKALDDFLKLVLSISGKFDLIIGGLKLLPLTMAGIICKLGTLPFL